MVSWPNTTNQPTTSGNRRSRDRCHTHRRQHRLSSNSWLCRRCRHHFTSSHSSLPASHQTPSQRPAHRFQRGSVRLLQAQIHRRLLSVTRCVFGHLFTLALLMESVLDILDSRSKLDKPQAKGLRLSFVLDNRTTSVDPRKMGNIRSIRHINNRSRLPKKLANMMSVTATDGAKVNPSRITHRRQDLCR